MNAAQLYNICNKGNHHPVMNYNPVTLISGSRTTMLAIVTERCLKAEIETFWLTDDTTNKVRNKLRKKISLKKGEVLKPIKI